MEKSLNGKLKQKEKSNLGTNPSNANRFEMCSREEAKNYLAHVSFSYSNIYRYKLETRLPGFSLHSIAYKLCNLGQPP